MWRLLAASQLNFICDLLMTAQVAKSADCSARLVGYYSRNIMHGVQVMGMNSKFKGEDGVRGDLDVLASRQIFHKHD